jgi:ABC-type nitrate/sulfonate/bicarbonate transport system substrate-binding protein
MSMPYRIRSLAAVMAAGLLVAACGGASTPSAAPATQAAASAAAGQLPKPELTKIRIGVSAPTEPVQFAEKLADYLGYYKDAGFTDVSVTGFEGDGKALQALVAGQLDVAVIGSSTAINSVLTDTPIKIVSMNSVLNTDGLYCKPAIKAAADVKGKSIAISTFGGTSHGSALIAIGLLGLTPKDVVIQQVGGEGTRIAALKGGSVDCAVVGLDQDAKMKSANLNLLADVTKGGEWGRSGLGVRVDFIQKNPNTVLDVVAAALRAQNYMWTNNKDAGDKFADFTQQKPADGEQNVKDFLGYGLRSMIFTAKAFQAPKDVLAAVNPAMANVDINKAYDLSFLNKLKDIGFYQKYSIPLQ